MTDAPTGPTRWATWGRWLLGLLFVGAGLLHLVAPDAYAAAMPPWLPAHRALILASGVAEIAGGLGLLVPHAGVRRAAGWGLALLLVAVYPANVHMALAGVGGPAWALWARLPLQGALVAWALTASGAAGYGRRVNVPGHASSARPTSYGA